MQINIKLDKSFTTAFNQLCEEFGEDFKKLNGFSESQLNYGDFIDNFVDKNVKSVADASIDGNANASTRDITSLEIEMSKPHMKLLAFNKIFYELNKKYGYQIACDWLRNEWIGYFYMHDAFSSTFKSYCFAYDIEALVKNGLYFIANNFNNQPPKHLVTYTDFVGEFVSWASNRTSGACGLPSFLIYSYYFWKKDIENDYNGLNSAVVPGKRAAAKRLLGLMKQKDEEYRKNLQAKYRDQEFQRIIYKLNQPYLRVTQSAFTNFSIFDESYLVELFGSKKFPDGTPIIDYIDEIIQYQKDFMTVCSEVRSQNMMTFPVLTYALLFQDGHYVHEDFAKWCVRHNMKWADSNFFNSSDVTTLSNCCRLLSNVEKLGYFNSIGGSALEVGSVKVNTVNLARLAYENATQDEYIEALKNKIVLACQALDIIRHIIERDVEKGLLPNYTLDIIHLKSQYNTIGVIGIYEACEKFGLIDEDEFGMHSYSDSGIEFAKRILKTIIDVKDEFVKDKDYMINIEQVPAERCASILLEKDKRLFTDRTFDTPLYGNQWIPLYSKCTLKEKIRISAILDEACSGGSIAHINLESPLEDFDTAWKLANDIANAGVKYYAFNLRISACEHNHGFFGDVCPECGCPKKTSYQRIVGFLTPTSSYSDARKKEFAQRDWFEINSGDDLSAK